MLVLLLHGDWLTLFVALAYWALLFGIPILVLALLIRGFIRRRQRGE
jgi:hypothetical protein